MVSAVRLLTVTLEVPEEIYPRDDFGDLGVGVIAVVVIAVSVVIAVIVCV